MQRGAPMFGNATALVGLHVTLTALVLTLRAPPLPSLDSLFQVALHLPS